MKTTEDLESRLEGMFAAQADTLRVPTRDWDAFRPATPPTRRPVVRGVALAGVAAALVMAAVSVGSDGSQTVTTNGAASGGATTAPPSAPAAPFTTETKQVSLAAQAFLLEVADGGKPAKTFVGAQPIEIHGDPGTANEYTTLELIWREHDVEMRMNIYFKSDGRQWWSDEIRTYNGRPQGDWVTYTGDFFRSPLGTPYVGDLDVTASADGVAGRLRLPGLRLEAFRRPAACGAPTSPYALVPGVERVDLRLDPSGLYGVAVTLLDTATCLPAAARGDFEYRWTIEDPAVVKVLPFGERADLQPQAVGTTSAHVVAVDRSGVTVAEAKVTVQVATEGPGDQPVVVSPEGPPPRP